ncbi:MAG: DNA photolyase family protein [Cytophagales bacterium]|nr:DNA photolyase family protein [Cytophagales bacterium]
MRDSISIFWFRRDLRLDDNAGLYHALKDSKSPVLPIFIFDSEILDRLDDKKDARVEFIHQCLHSLQKEISQIGSSLLVLYGKPIEIWTDLMKKYAIDSVFTNHDYEPYAIKRDKTIQQLFQTSNIKFHTYKDQVIFEKDEVLSDSGKPYTVFTPYSRKWKSKLDKFYTQPYPTEKYFSKFYPSAPNEIPSLQSIGFHETGMAIPSREVSDALIKQYAEQRDYPSIAGTSRLSIHLRFGTVSIRKLVLRALPLNEQWLNELIWREFYMNILWHFPHVAKSAFKKEYENIPWRNNEHEFDLWCKGETGYPIVDAGMRELNATGFMHNRVRMIVASFLTKHLLIDWRWGEAYFAKKLLDFDLSANNGGWQWASGSGCDAAPYFRIFNPKLQTEKFDKNLLYIKKGPGKIQNPS